MNRRAVIDFDGVIFDASSFKKDYFALFESLGIPLRRIETTYEEAKQTGYYNADLHLEALGRELAEVGLAKRKTLHFLQDTSRYLFRDAIPFLHSLRKRGYRAYILSAGTPWFQKEKIDHSGVLEYVEDVCLTDEPLKISAFKRVYQLDSGPIFFIDDTAQVVEALKKIFPDIVAFQLRRKDATSRVATDCDGIVENLGQCMEKIIEADG